MREVKEKSPLKERAVETLKSAPQAAFRRGTDASFQQLRQELREAAQDGQPEDRYESGKITDTADHAVQEVRHLAEKAAHRLPKTKSEPQREARTESVPQHEQPRHPLQPTAVPREYPLQSQSQGNQSVRESASPIREKPVSPVNVQQPKTREYTPDAKAPASPSQYPTLRIHENAKAVPAETMPSTTEHSVRESASSIKEKTIPPTNPPQPKMREHTPTADASVQQSRHPASEIHEKPQAVHHAQVNRSVRELETSVREKPAGKARPAEQRSLGQSPASTEPSVPATPPTVQPSARTLPREKPIVFSPREPLATPKTDTTQFALPAIKTKEYIRKKRKKQNFLKEEASSIENTIEDSETFSPVIRTRETVREQQKLHVSHSAEQEQPALPQIRTRQSQAVSLNKLTSLDIQQFYKDLLENGRIREDTKAKKPGLSSTTVHGIHVMLKSALKRAVQERLIPFNPAEFCIPPKITKPELQVVPSERYQSYLTAAEQRGVLPMFYLELATGLRKGEIAALLWSDYDAQTQTIHVTKQYLFYNGQGTVSPPKSSTSVRYVSIPEEAAKLLEQEHAKHPKNPYMFPSPVTGEMYHPDAIVKIHRKICKDIGLEHVRFHDLRHSFATTALQCGVDVKTVSTMLGHSSAGFTLNVYTHSTSRMQQEAARTVGKVMPKMLER